MTAISVSDKTIIGTVFSDYEICIQTINIKTARLNSDDEKTRRQYMQELFESIGEACEKTFLDATTRDDVQKHYFNHVRLSDGYLSNNFRNAIKPITEDKEEVAKLIEKIWDWAFEDSGRINKLHLGEWLEIPTELLNNKDIDQVALRKGLAECLKSKQGRLACSISHMRALEEGQKLYGEKKIKAVLVTEDDIQFIQKPERFIEIFQSAMEDLKKRDWDVLMLGASSYMPSDKEGDYNAEKVAGSEHLVKVKYAYGNFAYLVNGPSIEKIIRLINNHLETNKEKKAPILAQDVLYAEAMGKYKLAVYSTEPKLVGCIPCFSNLCDTDMDYSEVLKRSWTLKP